MKRVAKKFLKRMLNNGGFISQGIYEEKMRFWSSDTKVSCSTIDISLFDYLKKNKFIYRDFTNRYYISSKGRRFIAPWYKKMWM